MDAKLKVPFPPDPNPKKPRFAVPPGTCDTHFHIMGPPEVFPYVASRLYTPPAAPVEHYLSMAKAIGMERGVMVVPAVHGFENAVMHDAIEKAGGKLRGMVRANPNSSEADNKRLHAQGVRGIRFNLRPELEGKFDKDEMLLIVSRIRNLPWSVCLHIEADLIIEQAELIRRLDMPVIIDHFGQVDSRDGFDAPAFRTVIDLLGEKHVWMKIASTDRRILAGEPYEGVVKLARAFIAKAPDRIIWGTDWPHAYVYQAGKMINDGDLISFVADFAPDEATRKKILVDNPARLFGF
ncbi:MAG TPA: amidohydrolase family protein [Stellaceae bacterium]|nr:amidohydrolase family protein [Stellaceae bacterium]